MAHHLLVDYENVPQIDPERLADDWRITIFVGSCQNALPFDLVQGVQDLGSRLEWIKVDGRGSNALDFHIAFYLGRLLTQSPQAQCFILSKDGGFDPLVRHLKKKGFHCRRINSLMELESQGCAVCVPPAKPVAATSSKPVVVSKPTTNPATTSEPNGKPVAVVKPNYTRVVEVLHKQQKGHPRTRLALTNHVAAIFQRQLPEAEVEELVNRLFVEGKVSEKLRTLTYAL